MAKIVNTIPQSVDPENHISLEEVVAGLPETIPYTYNVALTGRIRLGKQIGNLSFVAMTDDDLGTETRLFFSGLVESITSGQKCATITNGWRSRDFSPLWVYSDGKKCVKFESGKLISLFPPQPTDLPNWLPVSKVIERIKGIAWPFDVDGYLTGGMVREGGSFNDVDFIVGEMATNANGDAYMVNVATPELCRTIRAHLTAHINAAVGVNENYAMPKIDVGSAIMTNKGMVYACKVFSKDTHDYCFEA